MNDFAPPVFDPVSGGGECGALMRAFDWPASPLGAIENWPQPLKTLVSVMLSANQAMFVAWGPVYTLLYNDRYAEILGSKHPAAMGQPLLDVWSEIRDDIQPIAETAYAGTSVQMDDITLMVERHGYVEEAHFAFSYNPVRDESGAVAGLFCPCQDTTGQVLADRRRAEEIERRTRLIERAPGFIAILRGPEHIYEFINESYQRLIGGREVIHKTIREALPDLEGQLFYERLDTVYRTGQRFIAKRVAARLQATPDAPFDQRFLDFVYEPIRDETGAVTGIFVEGHDVTEQERAEDARSESETRFRNMADNAPVMMWVTDPDGSCTYLNKRWYEFTGQSAGEAEGFGWLNATHPDDTARTDAAFRTANAAHAPFRVEYRLRRADGVYRWAIDAASPRFDDDGEYLGYVGSVIDIDERREAEERLRVSEESRRLSIEAAEIGTWDLYLLTNALLWSERTKAAFGLAPDAVCSMDDFYAGLHPDDLAEIKEKFMAAIDPDRRATYDVEYRTIGRDDGVERWVAAKGRGLFDESGRCIRAIGTAIDITQRKATEERVRSSEARFRAAIDAIDGVLWNNNAAGEMIGPQAGWAALTGQTEAEYSGYGWSKAVHPDDAQPTIDAWNAAVAEHLPFVFEHRVRRHDGSWRLFSIRAVPTLGPDGTVQEWVGVHTDISDLRASEARLRELNTNLERQVSERSRELSNTWRVSPDILGIANAEGYFEASNPAWQTTLGWSAEEIRTTPLLEFVHPDDVTATESALADLQRGDPVLRYENRYRTKAGDYVWLSWMAVPEGKKFYCSARDITFEKRQAEELAARTVERDRIWQNSQDLMTVIDTEGVFLAVSPAVTKILGYMPDEWVGRSLFDFIAPEDRELMVAALARATNEALPSVENRYRHKDGSYRWLSWLAAPGGDRIFATARHITGEKEQEQALIVAQDALRQAQKMEAVGQLTGGIAHDFNNLLTGIIGSLDLLQRRVAEGKYDRVERYTSMAITSAQRAAALTQRLLAFSRRQPLDPKPVDANSLVASMDELLRRTLGPAVALDLALADDLWTTLCDPNQLESAILNLAINARDAMPDGGQLTIETDNARLDEAYARTSAGEIDAGEYIVLAVTDTGTGIPPDVLSRIFEPFFTTKPIGQGTGLGLSQLYGFARQSGGIVKVHSQPGLGSTFRLYLPRHLGAVHATIAPADPQAARRVASKTALVVEDEAAVRMLIVESLEELGHGAVEAVDGPSALRILHSGAHFDLMITDVGLPGLNGRQLADAAREQRPGLPILFVTGYAGDAAVGKDMLEPGMAIVTKPFASDVLSGKISDMIAN